MKIPNFFLSLDRENYLENTKLFSLLDRIFYITVYITVYIKQTLENSEIQGFLLLKKTVKCGIIKEQ